MRNFSIAFLVLIITFLSSMTAAEMETGLKTSSEFQLGEQENMTLIQDKVTLSSEGNFIDRGEYSDLSSKWADVEGGDGTQTSTVHNGTYSIRVEDNNNDRGGTGDFIERSFYKGKPQKISLDMRITGGSYHDTTINFVTNSEADGVRSSEEKTVFNLNMGNKQPEFKFCGQKMFGHNTGQWYHVEIKDINYTAYTADVYVDGTKELEDADFCSEEKTISGMRIMADAGGTGHDGFYDDIKVVKPAKSSGSYSSKIFNKTGYKQYQKVTVNTSYSQNSDADLVFKGVDRKGVIETRKIIDLSQGKETYNLNGIKGQATRFTFNGSVSQKGKSFSLNSINWSYGLIAPTRIQNSNHFKEGELSNSKTNSNKISLLNQPINTVEGFEDYSTGTSNIQNWETGDGCGTCQTDSRSESGSIGFYQDDGSLNNWSDDWQPAIVRDFTGNPLKGTVYVTGEYWESRSNHDGNFWVQACDGTNLAGIGTENPQFEAVTANGGEVINSGGRNYKAWTFVNMTLHLNEGKVDFYWNQDGDGTLDSDGYDIPSGKSICKVGVGPDAVWYVDDIGIKSAKGGGQGYLESGNYTTQELAFKEEYAWDKLGVKASLTNSNSLNATFKSLNSDGSVLGQQKIELNDGDNNYSLDVPDSKKTQVLIEGSTSDSSETWKLNSLKIHQSSGNPPIFNSVETQPQEWSNAQKVSLIANVSDPDGSISNVAAEVLRDGSIIKTESLSKDSGEWTFKNFFKPSEGDSEYKISINATDNTGLYNVNNLSTKQTENVSINWQHSGNADGFRVYSNSSSNGMVEVTNVNSLSFEHISTAFDSGDYICYQVKAYNNYGESQPTEKKCANIP